MTIKVAHIVLLAGGMSLFSCKDMPKQNHGAIVLGDSSTIVTERDPNKLQDLVTDLQPEIPPSENKDTEQTTKAEPPKDTAKKTVAGPVHIAQTSLSATAGVLAEFKDVSVLISNVTAKISGNRNLKKSNGAVYSLISGNINGNVIKVSGSVTKVSQRYQSIVVLRNELGTLPLETMTITSDWQPLKESKDGYRITGLDQSSLDYPEASTGAIRNAVAKAAQRHHMSRRKTQELVNSVRHARSPHQKPFSVNLRSAMWKIDGKDAQGHQFSKQIRIDVPM